MTNEPDDTSMMPGPDEPSDPAAGATGAAQPFFKKGDSAVGTFDVSGASITHMDDYPSYEIAEGLFFRPVFAENLSLNFVTFPPNSGFPPHGHAEEQISIVREGEMEFTIGEMTRLVGPGDVIVFPPHVIHEGRTFGDSCRIIDIFSPPRTGMREVIADANPQRSADVDRWWDASS
jgi:quercetin dioxygenase-like cupin family protein